jgi:hypothetical protein
VLSLVSHAAAVTIGRLDAERCDIDELLVVGTAIAEEHRQTIFAWRQG